MMYFASRLHRYAGIGRFFSVVTSLAALNGSSVFFTQIFIVSFHGLRNARYFPSGETCALIISGLPKITSRSMIGVSPFVVAAFCSAGADWAWVPTAHFSAAAVDFSCTPSANDTNPIANTIFQICLTVRTSPSVMTYVLSLQEVSNHYGHVQSSFTVEVPDLISD